LFDIKSGYYVSMRLLLKATITKTIGYHRFIQLMVLLKYNFILVFMKLNRPLKRPAPKIVAGIESLCHEGWAKFAPDIMLSSKDFQNVLTLWESALSKARNDSSADRVLCRDQDLIKNDSIVALLRSDEIASLCGNYFTFKFKVRAVQVWWGRPAFEASGYRQLHLDRNIRRALHIDINLMDMATGSGAVEIVPALVSDKVSRKYGVWGGRVRGRYRP
jgi:hypothetical protein